MDAVLWCSKKNFMTAVLQAGAATFLLKHGSALDIRLPDTLSTHLSGDAVRLATRIADSISALGDRTGREAQCPDRMSRS
jgi:hypothetical protein